MQSAPIVLRIKGTTHLLIVQPSKLACHLSCDHGVTGNRRLRHRLRSWVRGCVSRFSVEFMAPRFVKIYSLVMQFTIRTNRRLIISNKFLEIGRGIYLSQGKVKAIDQFGAAIIDGCELVPAHLLKMKNEIKQIIYFNCQYGFLFCHS